MVLMKRDGGGDVSEMTPLVNSVQREGHITRRHLDGFLSLHTSAVSGKPLMSWTASIYVSNAGAAGQCQGDVCKAASFTLQSS